MTTLHLWNYELDLNIKQRGGYSKEVLGSLTEPQEGPLFVEFACFSHLFLLGSPVSPTTKSTSVRSVVDY